MSALNKQHWAESSTESMYDKTLLRTEIALIRKHIKGPRLLDAGCGEGEGTLEYSTLKDVEIEALDISYQRLNLARTRLINSSNVTLHQHDVLKSWNDTYDTVISQRLIINLESLDQQRVVISHLSDMVKPGGRLILSEGSMNGANELNKFRSFYGLPPIPVPAHNLFMLDNDLTGHCEAVGLQLIFRETLGAYYLLTRGLQPALKNEFDWASEFNKTSSLDSVQGYLPCADIFSRIKLWIWEKP